MDLKETALECLCCLSMSWDREDGDCLQHKNKSRTRRDFLQCLNNFSLIKR